MKSKEKGEPYQLRWLKHKTVSQCCVPTCKSADIKAEKHEFTWDVICSTIGIATIKSPDNLCVQGITSRYIGCLMLSLIRVRPVVLRRHCICSYFLVLTLKALNLISEIPLNLVQVFKMMI